MGAGNKGPLSQTKPGYKAGEADGQPALLEMASTGGRGSAERGKFCRLIKKVEAVRVGLI